MSILFVLLTFLLFITISYLRGHPREAHVSRQEAFPRALPPPHMAYEGGFQVPEGYYFHLGHTWAVDEGRQSARVGMDAFAATLLGKLDRIDLAARPDRWVRQGQRLWSVTRGGLTAEMVSPVEGLITAANRKVLKSPNLATEDPYGEGWIALIQSPDLATDLKNLVKGTLVRLWMQTTLDRLAAMTSQFDAATARDGGLPIVGLLGRLEPGLQRKLIAEFFLT